MNSNAQGQRPRFHFNFLADARNQLTRTLENTLGGICGAQKNRHHSMIAGFETVHAARQPVQSTGDAACEEQSRNHSNAKRAATDSKCEEELIPLFGDEATNLRVSFDYCDRLAGMLEDRCVTADPT